MLSNCTSLHSLNPSDSRSFFFLFISFICFFEATKNCKEYFFVVHAQENTLVKDNNFIVVFNDITELKKLEKIL